VFLFLSQKEELLAEAQWRTAWALAHAFGHLWANVPEVVCLMSQVADGEQSPSAIRQIVSQVVAQEQDWYPGLMAPEVCRDATGAVLVVHTSGTGRVRWAVREDGSATIEVCRPDPWGVVLRATIGPASYAGSQRRPWEPDREVRLEQLGPFAQRHLAVLARAVAAAVAAEQA